MHSIVTGMSTMSSMKPTNCHSVIIYHLICNNAIKFNEIETGKPIQQNKLID